MVLDSATMLVQAVYDAVHARDHALFQAALARDCVLQLSGPLGQEHQGIVAGSAAIADLVHRGWTAPGVSVHVMLESLYSDGAGQGGGFAPALGAPLGPGRPRHPRGRDLCRG